MNEQLASAIDKTMIRSTPFDAATLLLVNFKNKVPTVLMGKRNNRHSFMPNKYVFPGGKVEQSDKKVNVGSTLNIVVEEQLLKRTRNPSPIKARSFALAAIRETFEETGLMLGRRNIGTPPLIPNTTWEHFSTFGIFPCLDCLHFIARAVTPPEYPKRFDTRFFLADVMEVGHSIDFLTTPNTEFTDLIWVPLQQAKTLDIPSITEKIIEEAEIRIASKLSPFLSVPFFYKKRNSFVRELL